MIDLSEIKFVKAIRNRAADYFREQEYQHVKRETEVRNLSQSRNIGIVFELTSLDDLNIVRNFVAGIRERNRKISALGYVTQKELLPQLKSDNEFDFISQADFNWHYKPESYLAKNFMDDGFDLLIDLSMQRNPALLYISAFADAKMKVARYDEQHKEYFDLMIEIQRDNSLKYLINQVKHYITKINEQNSQ